MQLGLVEHFYLFEISPKSCQLAKKRFQNAGLADRVTVINADFFGVRNTIPYDLVYWDSSLHHMFDSRDAIERTFKGLLPGGFFVVNDFVGKTRFQWSDAELELINSFRRGLPENVFTGPGGGRYPRTVSRPSVAGIVEADPSEAADSEAIVPALLTVLHEPLIIPTGGLIYHTGLNDILTNIKEDSPLLTSALRIDAALTNEGMYQYAVCIARKPE